METNYTTQIHKNTLTYHWWVTTTTHLSGTTHTTPLAHGTTLTHKAATKAINKTITTHQRNKKTSTYMETTP